MRRGSREGSTPRLHQIQVEILSVVIYTDDERCQVSWPHSTNNNYCSQPTARSLREIKFRPAVSDKVVVVVVVGSLLISGLEGDGNQCNCTAVYRPLLYSSPPLYTPDHCHHTLTLHTAHCRQKITTCRPTSSK